MRLCVFSLAHLLIHSSTHLPNKPIVNLLDIYYTRRRVYSQENSQKNFRHHLGGHVKRTLPLPNHSCGVSREAHSAKLRACPLDKLRARREPIRLHSGMNSVEKTGLFRIHSLGVSICAVRPNGISFMILFYLRSGSQRFSLRMITKRPCVKLGAVTDNGCSRIRRLFRQPPCP